MHRIFVYLLTISLLTFPAMTVQASSHTNIPDTHKYVSQELNSFTQFVSRETISNQELSQALTDLEQLLEIYQRILERRSNSQ